jgi:hypothetical protein
MEDGAARQARPRDFGFEGGCCVGKRSRTGAFGQMGSDLDSPFLIHIASKDNQIRAIKERINRKAIFFMELPVREERGRCSNNNRKRIKFVIYLRYCTNSLVIVTQKNTKVKQNVRIR